ncbi:glycosyltransferase [Parasphingorhabdus halotolerans]|nr:glycosyltransferase [Parasphingorhabdus halotolerans]
MTKFFARAGHTVTVCTTSKSGSDGEFTEETPKGVAVFELDRLGRISPSEQGKRQFEDMYSDKPSFSRRLKAIVMDLFGQLPDPRLPFALGFGSPFLAPEVKQALRESDVVVGSCPPWPLVLASLIVSKRFGPLCIMDYRDPFSDCHEMPGGRFAKFVEKVVDKFLVRRADAVVAISGPMAEYYRNFNPKTSVIMNGYDHEVIEQVALDNIWQAKSAQDPIVLRYMGLVSPGRVPHNLLAALTKAVRAKPELLERLRFEYYGPGDIMRKTLDAEYPDIAELFHFNSNIPYRQALGLMLTADYLLFCETSSKHNLSAQGILTTKLFEYIASGRRIVADIDKQTLAGGLVAKADASHVISTDPNHFEEFLLSDGFLSPGPSKPSLIANNLSRKFAADQYMELMKSMVFPTKN